jgi:transglutaminase-like putative cysteine protease
MFFSIRHFTCLTYTAPISESVTELRMDPRSEGVQRCLWFHLTVTPRAKVFEYRDPWGNCVRHFDIPGNHLQVALTAQALVEIHASAEPPVSELIAAPGGWDDLDHQVNRGDFWELLQPSQFAKPTSLLRDLQRELRVGQRRERPLELVREINEAVFNAFEYMPNSTQVDSPIDEALRNRKGVCQDFAHIMITLLRELGIPCRYVSGYLYHRSADHDRSSEGATHAWVEAFLPDSGWIGFDPTNNLVVHDRHIRVAVGRDYADVPPTRGVYKGSAKSTLKVGVRVLAAEARFPEEVRSEELPSAPGMATDVEAALALEEYKKEHERREQLAQQQQQQQQQ